MLLNKYFILEGIDGSGKTTLINNLKTLYKDATFVSEPTKNINKQYLNNLATEDTQGARKLLYELFLEDRNILFEDIILPNLKRNKIVFSDRSYISSMVYQNDVKEPLEMIRDHNHLPRPGLIFLIDIDHNLAYKRIKKRKLDDLDFFNTIRLAHLKQGYLNLRNYFISNFVILDGSNNENVLAKQVKSYVDDYIRNGILK